MGMTAYGSVVVEWNPYRVQAHGDFNGSDGAWFPRREVEFGERGVVVALTHRERVFLLGREYDGRETRAIEVRRWHDGTLTVEREHERR